MKIFSICIAVFTYIISLVRCFNTYSIVSYFLQAQAVVAIRFLVTNCGLETIFSVGEEIIVLLLKLLEVYGMYTLLVYTIIANICNLCDCC